MLVNYEMVDNIDLSYIKKISWKNWMNEQTKQKIKTPKTKTPYGFFLAREQSSER